MQKNKRKWYKFTEKRFNGFLKDRFPSGNKEHIVSVAIRNKNRSKHQQLGVPYGTFPKQYHLVFNKDLGVSYAVKSASHEFMIATMKLDNIRGLTPKECFRLMGFFEDEINLEGLSESQKYDLAGNGWDINLISKIFKKMFEN